MAAVYTAEEILEIAGGRLASGMLEPEAGAICTDTRQLKEGDWFLALAGQKFDGHDFLGDAFAGGAIGAVVAERSGYSIGSNTFPLVAVEDTAFALSLLARNWRRRIGPQVVIFCGEIQEMNSLVEFICARLLSDRSDIVCLGNQAKASTAAIDLLNMPDDTRVVIAGLSPVRAEEIELLGVCLEANVLAFLPFAFENLRLTTGQEELRAARATLIENLNKNWSWVLCDSARELEGVSSAKRQTGSLAANMRYFETPEWQKKRMALDENQLASYDKAIALLAPALPAHRGWMCVNALGLIGIDPKQLVEMIGQGKLA